ncbi:type VI secretion system Vgr family protein [Candidatus Paracaedibacter symbiosus]|uniref:type VI secretion system Vgr family protein n=1 Tax=Candidatus Paracaedibacter symbiosus TaxID=244582 RepID=UPI00050987E3|nr:type VI secretion system tip protein TssI/VgrG [Candidatus Paracaedibacter symbiosus]
MLTTQQHQKIKVFTALNDDALILDQLYGYERTNEPYCFTLKMHSQQLGLNFDDIIGSNFEVEFEYGHKKRYFGGIVGEIEQLQSVENDKGFQAHYQLKIYPRLWLLKFSSDHQIFQNKTTIEIIKSVLQEQGVSQLEDKTTGCGHSEREYCVQYGETHYDFVCRLMEEEGIFYYFEHTRQGEKMILLDDSSSVKAAESESLRQMDSTSGEPLYNQIVNMSIAQQVVAKRYATADYNFTTASTKLYNKITGEGAGGQIYRYPGIYLDSGGGDDRASHRIQELEWFKKTVKGTSTVPKFAPMYSFSVTNHPRPDANDVYVLYEVIHTLDFTSLEEPYIYKNDFKAFPSMVTYRPPIVTPKPIIPSTQTAKVTGKEGEEIWCDEYGRIKVKFHWDQNGSEDEKSSCWIRVAQLWAGSNWGGLWTPRVGMEVIVTFLEGNPDRPLITGCVYNSDNMPPYAKDEPTKSTIKSNSTKDGGTDNNEFRFEDKKGSEEIFIHAQKDMNTVVEDNRSLKINAGDDTTDIMAGDRTVTLHGEKRDKRAQRGNDTLVLSKGSRTVKLNAEGKDKANHLLELTRGDNTITLKEGDFVITLNKGNQTIDIKGSLTIKVTGAINFEGDDNITIKAGGDIKLISGGDTNLSASGNFTAKGAVSKVVGQMGGTFDGGPSLSLTSSGSVSVSGSTISIG